MGRLAVLTLLLAGCKPEYGVQPGDRLDVFRQNRLDAIDLLLVVDNSCSMVDEQEHLALSFQGLMDALQSGQSDWRVAVTTSEPTLPEYRGQLAGGTDEIVLVAPDGRLLDRVAYDDQSWDIARGTPLERCGLGVPEILAFQQAEGEGTPGAHNPCSPTVPLTSGTDGGPVPPEPGELVVNEFLPWAEEDALCEWVELANLTSHTLDLSGLTVRDEGRDVLVVPPAVTVGPGGFFTLGRADAPETCGTQIDLPTGEQFHLAHGIRWVDAQTQDAQEVFSELVAVGTGAFGLEMGMENALVTLQEQLEETGQRARFLRDEADLALLFFSDEDDLSPWSVATYLDALRAIKGTSGQRDPHRVRVGVAVGTEPAPAGSPSCSSDLGQAVYAERYVALAELADGLAWSICGDLSQVAQQAGLTFSELVSEFRLSELPALDTLEVDEYAGEDESTYVGPLFRGQDYELEVRTDDLGQDALWVIFPQGRVPPGHIVTFTYEILPETAEIDLGEG
jgi:hypothetical protein